MLNTGTNEQNIAAFLYKRLIADRHLLLTLKDNINLEHRMSVYRILPIRIHFSPMRGEDMEGCLNVRRHLTVNRIMEGGIIRDHFNPLLQ
ncbi:hypothetical protein D3C78_954630 [compost metagenome]